MAGTNQNIPPWVFAERFRPKNEFGEYLPASERWGDIAYEEDERIRKQKESEKIQKLMDWVVKSKYPEEIKTQIVKLYKLNKKAKSAKYRRNVLEPKEGDFKTSDDGKIYRYTTQFWKKIDTSDPSYNATKAAVALEKVPNPTVGDYKKVKGKIFRWTQEPAWLQVDRKTNFNIDLADTFDRYERFGKPYLNARDELWSIFYPNEAAIYRPKAYQRRNTRRNRRVATRKNRKNTRRNK